MGKHALSGKADQAGENGDVFIRPVAPGSTLADKNA